MIIVISTKTQSWQSLRFHLVDANCSKTEETNWIGMLPV